MKSRSSCRMSRILHALCLLPWSKTMRLFLSISRSSSSILLIMMTQIIYSFDPSSPLVSSPDSNYFILSILWSVITSDKRSRIKGSISSESESLTPSSFWKRKWSLHHPCLFLWTRMLTKDSRRKRNQSNLRSNLRPEILDHFKSKSCIGWFATQWPSFYRHFLKKLWELRHIHPSFRSNNEPFMKFKRHSFSIYSAFLVVHFFQTCSKSTYNRICIHQVMLPSSLSRGDIQKSMLF